MLVFYLFIYIEIPLEPLLDNMEEKIKKTFNQILFVITNRYEITSKDMII